MAILFQIIFVIVVIFLIHNTLSKESKIENRNQEPYIFINGLSDNPVNLPNSHIIDLSRSLTDTVKYNTQNLDLSKAGAIIRKDSVTIKEFSRQGFTALSFIVDLPNLEQSYQIYYKYPTDTSLDTSFNEFPRAVLCLDDSSQNYFPDFKCRSEQPTNIRQRIATDYMHYLEFNTFTINMDPDDRTKIDINPIVNGSSIIDESYIQQVKDAISELGISPDLFKYHIVNHQDLDYVIR